MGKKSGVQLISRPNFVPLINQKTIQGYKPEVCEVVDFVEALTAVQVALLTIYDMCKAVDRGMTITDVKLLEKHGGKSGSFVASS